MRTPLVLAVRILIVIMVLGCLVAMGLLLPLFGSQTVEMFPEVAHLFWPVLFLTEAFMVAALVVLVSMWVLVGMAGRDAVFSARAFRWVDAIIAAFLVAGLIAFGTSAWIVGVLNIGGAATGMLGLAATVGSLAGAALMALMRGLLTQATAMQDYLAEVV